MEGTTPSDLEPSKLRKGSGTSASQNANSLRKDKSDMKLFQVMPTQWYDVHQASNKGLGCFAKRSIPKGTRILEDRLLAAVPCLEYNAVVTHDPSNITAALSTLSRSDRALFFALDCPTAVPGSAEEAEDIWEANAFSIDAEHTGIFLRTARINHACVPNAEFAWNLNIDRGTVHAVTYIPEGAEITLSYCNPALPYAQRMFELGNYGFICRCACCASPGQEYYEARRVAMTEAKQAIDSRVGWPALASWKFEVGENDPLSECADLVHMSLELGIVGTELSEAYHELSEVTGTMGAKGLALFFAREELRINLTCLGADHEVVKSTMDWIAELKWSPPSDIGWLFDDVAGPGGLGETGEGEEAGEGGEMGEEREQEKGPGVDKWATDMGLDLTVKTLLEDKAVVCLSRSDGCRLACDPAEPQVNG